MIIGFMARGLARGVARGIMTPRQPVPQQVRIVQLGGMAVTAGAIAIFTSGLPSPGPVHAPPPTTVCQQMAPDFATYNLWQMDPLNPLPPAVTNHLLSATSGTSVMLTLAQIQFRGDALKQQATHRDPRDRTEADIQLMEMDCGYPTPI